MPGVSYDGLDEEEGELDVTEVRSKTYAAAKRPTSMALTGSSVPSAAAPPSRYAAAAGRSRSGRGGVMTDDARARAAVPLLADAGVRYDPDIGRAGGGAGASVGAAIGGDQVEGGDATAMLLDDDVLGGADPLDCVGIPPDEDPHADAELVRALGDGGGGGDDGAADVLVYSYGSPRIGNRAFARMYNRRVPNTFRLVLDGDAVTGIPKLLWVYKHCGIEVWLDGFGNHIVNPSFVERTFRTASRTSLSAHRTGSYRRGLIHARRNEGLLQFRQWAAQQAAYFPEDVTVSAPTPVAPSLPVPVPAAGGGGGGGGGARGAMPLAGSSVERRSVASLEILRP